MHHALKQLKKHSEAIAGYLYLPKQRKLVIQFQNSGLGMYEGVTPQIALGLDNLESAGKYHATEVKPYFPYVNLNDWDLDSLIQSEGIQTHVVNKEKFVTLRNLIRGARGFPRLI